MVQKKNGILKISLYNYFGIVPKHVEHFYCPSGMPLYSQNKNKSNRKIGENTESLT